MSTAEGLREVADRAITVLREVMGNAPGGEVEVLREFQARLEDELGEIKGLLSEIRVREIVQALKRDEFKPDGRMEMSAVNLVDGSQVIPRVERSVDSATGKPVSTFHIDVSEEACGGFVEIVGFRSREHLHQFLLRERNKVFSAMLGLSKDGSGFGVRFPVR
jgi:molecular chaperone DnaK (HSP70)